MKLVDQSVVEGADAIADRLSGGLADLLGPDIAARWRIRRDQYRPRLVLSSNDNGVVAAALTTGRPATAAVKIVDLWCSDHRAVDTILDTIIGLARQQNAVVVKWERRGDAELPEAAVRRGFVPMQPMGTAEGTDSVTGHALWLSPIPHVEPRHYTQSTEFTCGAVAALLAAELAGSAGFAGDLTDRRVELDFWRAASNFPACEPIGLAVAIRRRLGDRWPVEVALDTDTPLFLDEFVGFDREFRAELQDDSRRQAGELGIPVRRDRVDVTHIAHRISGGEIALLLITQTPMHGHREPHWITAHASDGTSLVVVQDPWIDRPAGETWVDAHDLPIALADLDRMCHWGQAEHRGVVFLARRPVTG